MNKLTAWTLAAAASVLLAGSARAQVPHVSPFAFEVRGGIAIPTGDFNDVADPGYTLNGNATLYVIPTLGIYGGYRFGRFGHPGSGHYNESGPEVGLRLDFPTPTTSIDPYVRAGFVWNKLELTGAGASDFSSTSNGIQFNAGVAFSLGTVSLTPGITYVTYKYDTTTLDDQTASYIRADVGIRIRI